MEIKLFKPKSHLLHKYIQCFYILTRKAEENPISYFTFPTNFTIHSIDSKAATILNKNSITATAHPPENGLDSFLAPHAYQPLLNRYESGEANEITIYFKPLGINAFLEDPLSFYYDNRQMQFIPFADYRPKMIEILSIKENESKIQELEEYWLSKLKGFEHPFLHGVVNELMEGDNAPSIGGLAEKYEVSRVTLNRHFALHLCKTPSEFRKVVRFRKSLESYGFGSDAKNLTSITHQSAYFDQSHMIKDFNAFTNHSPKKFFSKLSSIKNGQINWLFL
jgi:AraC-like DNA-binding protein